MMPGGQPVDGDAHEKIVRGFRAPRDAWETQARIRSGEELTWGFWLGRHAPRAKRNEHRVRIAQTVALFSRSVDAWGSAEAAGVAAMRVTGTRSMLDELMKPAPVDNGSAEKKSLFGRRDTTP